MPGAGAAEAAYIVDANRDTQSQKQYAATPHTLIVGIARMSGKEYRFRLFKYDGTGYSAIEQEAVDTSLPILFKPLGTPLPESNYIASDADFVDYITELMGGFAIPSFVKRLRQADARIEIPRIAGIRGEHHRVLGELLQFNRSLKRSHLPLVRAYVTEGAGVVRYASGHDG